MPFGRISGSRTIPFLLATWLLASGAASAQTGTIAGTVTDKDGAGVPYANVTLEGTTRGGNTSIDGRYVIGKVPVGRYTLRIKSMRFETALRTDVEVRANGTTRVDFRVSEKAYRLPTTEVVVDKRFQTTTSSEIKRIINREEIRHIPADDLKRILELKSGVINQGGEIHVRGGRVGEVMTIVDGIPSRNPLDAQNVDVSLAGTSEVEAVLGGMNAQYGNVLSGVVNITTREGGDKTHGELRFLTDRYGEPDKSFNNFQRLSAGIGGPFFVPRSNYFLSFEGTYTDTPLRNVARHREHRFLDFIRLGNRQSNSAKLSGKFTHHFTQDQKLTLEFVKNQSLEGVFNNRWNREGYVRVFQDSTPPTDGSVTTTYGDWSWYPIDSTYVPMNTADHLPVSEEDYLQTSVAWRHTVGTAAIYNVRASRQEWKNTSDVLERNLWEYQQRPNNYYDFSNRNDGAYYVTNGDFPFFERKRTVTYTVNGDLTKKIGAHEFMTGWELNYNELGFLRTHFPNVVTSMGLYGQDRDQFRFFNPEGSLFLQDHWKYQGLVLNAGVRYDNFSVGKQIPSSEVADRVKTQISPRIGMAYPITERDVMSFHYGHFFQVPERQFIYEGRLGTATARGNTNLEPQTTISYQLGVQHLVNEDLFFQFGVYFKDVFGLLTTVPREVPGFATTVQTYVNGDYASERGLEFSLTRRFKRGFGFELNYGYGYANGTASDPERALPERGNLRDQFKPNTEQPLRWDQRHTFSATLSLADENVWRTSFVYQFGSGFPYTPHERDERRQNPELVYSKRLPSLSSLSMQGERMFTAWGQNLTLYVQATNLLDAQGITNLQPDLTPLGAINGESYNIYYEETHRAGGAFLTQDQDGDGRDDWYPVHDPSVFQAGRAIRLGLGVEF